MSSDSDDEYDPSAVAAAPPSATTSSVEFPAGISTPFTSVGTVQRDPPASRDMQTTEVRHLTAREPSKYFKWLHSLRLSQRSAAGSAAVTPGGSLLAVGNADGSLMMFDFTDPTTQQQQQQQQGHSTSGAGKPRIVPTRTMTPFPRGPSEFNPVTFIHFSALGKTMFAGYDGDGVLMVDASTGRQMGFTAIGSRSVVDCVRSAGHKGHVTSLSVHPADEKKFCTSSMDGTVRLWDATNAKRTSAFCAKHGRDASSNLLTTIPLFCTSFVGNGDVVASGGEDGCVQLWDTRTAFRPGRSALACVLDDSVEIGAMLSAAASSSTLLLRCSDGSLRRVDLRSPNTQVDQTQTGMFSYSGSVATMTRSATGSVFMSVGAGRAAGGGVAEVSNVFTGTLREVGVKLETAMSEACGQVAVDAEHSQFFVGTHDGHVQLRSYASGAHTMSPIQDLLLAMEGSVAINRKRLRPDDGPVDVYF